MSDRRLRGWEDAMDALLPKQPEDDYDFHGQIVDHGFADCCGCFHRKDTNWICNECGIIMTETELQRSVEQ